MAELNLDDFYRDAAKALLLLLTQFPRRTTLLVEDLIGPDTPDEFGLPSPRHLACFEALIWLGAQGYLRYQDVIRQEALEQAVLSERALLILTHPATASVSAPADPGSIDDRAFEPASAVVSYSKLLREQLRSGSSETLARAFRSLMVDALTLR